MRSQLQVILKSSKCLFSILFLLHHQPSPPPLPSPPQNNPASGQFSIKEKLLHSVLTQNADGVSSRFPLKKKKSSCGQRPNTRNPHPQRSFFSQVYRYLNTHEKENSQPGCCRARRERLGLGSDSHRGPQEGREGGGSQDECSQAAPPWPFGQLR